MYIIYFFNLAINDHFKNVNRKLKRDGDLEMAYDDLLRLQKTYNVPVSDHQRHIYLLVTVKLLE